MPAAASACKTTLIFQVLWAAAIAVPLPGAALSDVDLQHTANQFGLGWSMYTARHAISNAGAKGPLKNNFAITAGCFGRGAAGCDQLSAGRRVWWSESTVHPANPDGLILTTDACPGRAGRFRHPCLKWPGWRGRGSFQRRSDAEVSAAPDRAYRAATSLECYYHGGAAARWRRHSRPDSKVWPCE